MPTRTRRPFAVGTSARAVPQASVGRLAATVWANTVAATGRAGVDAVVIVNRCPGVQRSPSFLRRRLIRPPSAGTPSARTSAWSRSGPLEVPRAPGPPASMAVAVIVPSLPPAFRSESVGVHFLEPGTLRKLGEAR